MQIDKNEFQELLKEVKLYNKLDLAAQAIQTKYAKDMAGDDHEQRLAAQKETNELLKGILVSLGGTKTKSQASVKKSTTSGSTGLSLNEAIKNDFKLFKEELKAGFGFTKDMFKGIAGVFKPSAKDKIEQQSKTENPNIQDTAEEIMADQSKKQTGIFSELLDTLNESLDQLKAIRNSLEGSPEPLKKGTPSGLIAPAAPAAGAGGLLGSDGLPIPPVIPSVPSRPAPIPPTPTKPPAKPPTKTPPAKPSLGSRILGGAAKVGRFAMMGLAAKPMLIGAAIAGTAYAGYKGYEYLKSKEQKTGEEISTPGYDAATEQMAGGAVDPSSLPPPPAPVTTKPAEAKAVVKKTTPTKPSTLDQDTNLENFQKAKGELQGLYADYRDEKQKVKESLVNSKKYPDGFIDDESDPEYPNELKAIDNKYKPLIEAQKKEVEKLSKAPGIKEAQAREANFDKMLDDSAPAAAASTVTGTTVKTSATTSVSGGGSETTKMVLSEDAKKAQAEGAAMSKRHQEEYTELRNKLEAEGKLVGKSRRDVMNIPEIKELRARQSEEQNTRGKRVTDGMTYEVSKISGENQNIRDEMTTPGGGQPIVMNNVSSNNTTSYVPIKGEPRATQRGSALDRYNDRVAAY